MKSHGVGLGRTALLRCEAAAVPTPSFEWYKGEKRINKGQGIDIKNLSSRSVLTVTNMTEDRYGNYTCVAANILGRANASVPLIHSRWSSTWDWRLRKRLEMQIAVFG
uniref:Ig-like domain-containing protein n=1 Tax=Hucho hucho TaxID=62062 RepID=A0A4W5QN25_9TELE